MTVRPALLRRFHPDGLLARGRVRSRLARAIGGRTIVVAGSRRSGNHAVIAWLANALAGRPAELRYLDWRFGFTAGAEVLHANDLPADPKSLRYGELDRSLRRALASAVPGTGRVGDLVMSFEDVRLTDLTGAVVLGRTVADRILVTRPLLDLVASRTAWTMGKGTGPAATEFAERDAWLQTELANRAGPLEGWIEVPFDRFLTEPALRRAVLDRLGLGLDAPAERISPLGGGSSFGAAGRVPAATDLTSRREQVAWAPDLVRHLLDPRFRPLLRDDDVAFLEERLRG